jgi:hypothetical protein
VGAQQRKGTYRWTKNKKIFKTQALFKTAFSKSRKGTYRGQKNKKIFKTAKTQALFKTAFSKSCGT